MEEVIRYILEILMENADEVSKEERTEFNEGKRLAYYEVLDCFKDQFEIYDIDIKKYGLDKKFEDLL